MWYKPYAVKGVWDYVKLKISYRMSTKYAGKRMSAKKFGRNNHHNFAAVLRGIFIFFFFFFILILHSCCASHFFGWIPLARIFSSEAFCVTCSCSFAHIVCLAIAIFRPNGVEKLTFDELPFNLLLLSWDGLACSSILSVITESIFSVELSSLVLH